MNLKFLHTLSKGGVFMEREKYYVNITHQAIGKHQYSDNDFTVYATVEEVRQIRGLLNNIYAAELDTYWRAHVPIMPYHNDPSNDRYDTSFTNVLKIIYELGDEQAKNYVKESGILNDRPMDTNM